MIATVAEGRTICTESAVSRYCSHQHTDTERNTVVETNLSQMRVNDKFVLCSKPHASAQTAVRTMMLRQLGPVVADFGQSNFGQSIFGQPIWASQFLANPFLAQIRGQWLVVWPTLANPILANLFLANLFLLCCVVPWLVLVWIVVGVGVDVSVCVVVVVVV